MEWPRHIDRTAEARARRREAEARSRIDKLQRRQVTEKPQYALGNLPRPVNTISGPSTTPATGGQHMQCSLFVPSDLSLVSVRFYMKFKRTGDTVQRVALYADGNKLMELIQDDFAEGQPPGIYELTNAPDSIIARPVLFGGARTFLVCEQTVFEPDRITPIEFGIEFGASHSSAVNPYDARQARLHLTVE